MRAFGEKAVLFVRSSPVTDKLMTEKGGKNVPYIVLLEPDGKVLAPYKGPHRVEDFERARTVGQTLRKLRAVAAPTPQQQLDRLVAEAELALVTPKAAREQLAKIPKLTSAQKDAANRTISDAQVLKAWYKHQPRTLADRAKIGKRYWVMLQNGCKPKRKAAAQAFYLMICEYAWKERDAKIYRRSLKGLRAWLVEQGADADRVLRPFEARLKRLEK